MKTRNAEFVLSAASAAQFLRERSEIAFIGRSNVGKSTLLNRLLGRKKLARTSSTPGRTRTVNYFLVDEAFYFVDLPGYGYAKAGRSEREAWARLVDSYFQSSDRSLLVVLLVDAKVGATPLDEQAVEFMAALDLEVQPVATKCDRLKQSQRMKALDRIGRTLDLPEGIGAIPVSGLTGEGVNVLWRRIRQHALAEARKKA